MGSAGTLDTEDVSLAERVVGAAVDAGTALFDTSPMYGRAEAVLGTCLTSRRSEVVVASKVWTEDDDEAEGQLDSSVRTFGGRVDLMQIHNMVQWRTRLDQVEVRRDRGEIGLVGATHWKPHGFADLEAAMRTGRLDAVQVPYNPVERDVEQRILPLAADLGLGVVVMRPFANAALLASPPPPERLRELEEWGVRTWGHALLAWCLSHPAVTVAIPATVRPERAAENAYAGGLAPFDVETRNRVARWFAP